MLTASVLALSALAQPTPAMALVPPAAQTQWIKDHAIPLKTVEAGHGFEDLEPLKKLIGNARIVALGEPTHGTREAFQMKHRLVEFLSQQMGFTVFSIEASMPEAFAVDDFVSGWRGNAQRAIRGMGFWTWTTEEVLDMVRWMRRNNEKGPNTIRFTGFDMQNPDGAMKCVLDLLDKVEADYAATARGSYNALKSAASRDGSGFGVATGSFPVEAAAGKHLVFSGWIRTQDLAQGYAGLWWRVDGKDGGTGAFDNMAGKGPSGTTAWKQYTIELEIPAGAANINFGVLMPGKGKAWFDDLSITLDGKEYAGADLFDFGFEGGALKGLVAPGPGQNAGYTATIDHEQAHTGKASLLLSSGAAAPDEPKADGPTPAAAAKLAADVLTHMESRRDKYAHDTNDDEADWAIQNARIVAQCFKMRAGNGFKVRDESMAANIKWILDNSPPNTKIVLWAHNGHVAREAGFMGSHLAKMYGKDYCVLGFSAGSGRYTAMGDGGLGGHDLTAPAAGSFEWFAASTGMPLFILPTRDASPQDGASSWLTEPLKIRSIGAMAQTEQFATQELSIAYDAVIYLRETTEARQMAK